LLRDATSLELDLSYYSWQPPDFNIPYDNKGHRRFNYARLCADPRSRTAITLVDAIVEWLHRPAPACDGGEVERRELHLAYEFLIDDAQLGWNAPLANLLVDRLCEAFFLVFYI
jgi:hypothetical protein